MNSSRIVSDSSRFSGLLLLVAAVVFFLPGLRPGRVLLPLDILCGVSPWNVMKVCAGTTPANPVISDQVFAFHPWYEIQKRDGWHGFAWNPYAFAGSPLAGNGQSAPFYPPNWLHWLLPATWSYVLLAIFRTAVAALFTLAFARRYVSEPAALLAAVSYAFTYTFVFSVGYPFGDAMAWLPAVLWAVDSRRWVLTGIFTALELLSGHPETAIVAAFCIGVWFLSKRPSRGELLRAAGAVALGLLFALPQLIPMLHYIPSSAAASFRSQGYPLIYSAHTLLEFLTPEFFGTSAPTHRWGSNPGGFFGLATFILAIGFVVRPRNAIRNPWTLVFVVALCLIYRIPPLTWLLELPYLRVVFANQFWVAVAFSGAMLGAYGLDEHLHGRIPKSFLFVVLPLVLCVVILFARWHFSDFISALQLSRFETAVLMKFIVSLFLTLIVLRRRPKWTAAVVFAECVLYLVMYNTAAPAALLYPRPPVVDFLKKDPARFRIMGDGVLPPNTAAIYGLEDLRGYDAVAPMPWFRTMEGVDPDFSDFLSRQNLSTDSIRSDTLFQRDHFLGMLDKYGAPFRELLMRVYYWNDRLTQVRDPKMLDLLNVKYYLVPHDGRMPSGLEDWQRAYSAEVDAYLNPHVYPRAYVLQADQAEPIAGDIVEYLPDEVVVRAPGPGTLVLADAWDPGWHAEGFTITPYRQMLRSVTLPPGEQTIRFRFSVW
jgi:Bacterial membrane protein YfhO